MELTKFQRLPMALLIAKQLYAEEKIGSNVPRGHTAIAKDRWVRPENEQQRKAWFRFVEIGFAKVARWRTPADPCFRVTLDGLAAYLRSVASAGEDHCG